MERRRRTRGQLLNSGGDGHHYGLNASLISCMGNVRPNSSVTGSGGGAIGPGLTAGVPQDSISIS